jgi:hypothetical protein
VGRRFVHFIGSANLSVSLQTRDYIEERGMSPGLNDPFGSRGGDDDTSLFDYAELLEF